MSRASKSTGSSSGISHRDRTKHVVPLVEEQLEVSRERIDTGTVRIEKSVAVREAVVDEPTVREEVRIERRAVGREVDAAPPVRVEGDTTIVPVLEEVVVVSRRLVLREELHITRVRVEERHVERVPLRRETLDVERTEAADEEGRSADAGAGPETPNQRRAP